MRNAQNRVGLIAACEVVVLAVGCGSPAGSKVESRGSELYYSSAVEEEEAQKLVEFLAKRGSQRSIQLDKDGDLYQLRITVDEDQLEFLGEVHVVGFQRLASDVSRGVFDGAEVQVLLCDDNFDIWPDDTVKGGTTIKPKTP